MRRWLRHAIVLTLTGCSLGALAAYLRTSGAAIADLPRTAPIAVAQPLPQAVPATETALFGAAVEWTQEVRFVAQMTYSAEAAAAAAAKTAQEAVWDRMAACETGGRWSMRGSTYSGGLGIHNDAWGEFGGHRFAPNAGMATREEQVVVAERIRARYGYSAWGCADNVGLA